jgi:hypothetical protein
MPDILRRKYLGEFTIYTQEEADKEGIDYKPWHEAQEQMYAISDDGYVAKVRNISTYPKKYITGVEVKLPYGSFWYEIKNGEKRIATVCSYLERRAKRAYSIASAKSFGERMISSERMRKMMRIAASMLVKNGEIDYEYLGQMFFKKHRLPAISVKMVLKKKESQEYLMEQTEKQLAKWGIDDEYIIQKCFKRAVEIAEANGDADILLRVGKELATLKNMYPSKKIVTNQIEMSKNTQYLEDNINKIEEQLSLVETISLDEQEKET